MNDTTLFDGEWLNAPVSVERRLDAAGRAELAVTAAPNSDFWRTTSYGFIHDTGHALLNDFSNDTAIEVSWILDYSHEFDQAGVFVWHDEHNWIKAGVEMADGAPQLGAVVTREMSDWSVAPVAEWHGREVHLRASRSGDALTIRARCDGEWRLVRLVPLDPSLHWRAGLFCASPLRSGLTVRFTQRRMVEADASLH